MKVHEFWRAEYRKRRYLEHICQDELEQRVRDIFANMTELTPEGKLGCVSMNKGGAYWMKMWTDVLEELDLRNGGFRPAFLKSTPMSKPCWPQAPRAYSALGGRDLATSPYLFKFGKLKYLLETMRYGRIRVAPASSYSDPSLNYAMRDDELSFTIQLPGGGAYIRKLDKATLHPSGEKIPVLGNISQTHSVPTDYLVFCLSAKYGLRAVDDFEADCCLVIKNAKAFIDRLLGGVFAHVPTWVAKVNLVDYLDPLNTKPDEIRPYFSKHFRYAYQNELRIVWIPVKPELRLDPVFAMLGPLDDIAELLVLPPG